MESSNNNLALIIAVCVVLGIVIGYLLWKKFHEPKPIFNVDKFLSKTFGEPMYAVNFSLKEARDWIKQRKDKLDAGQKAVLCKLNSKSMHMFTKELEKLNVNASELNYLVLTIVDVNNNDEISDTLLVKYEKLSAGLEEALAKGNGSLVVEA